MARRKKWSYSEEKLLIDSYAVKTIKELQEILKRDADSINCKIKRLKAAGKITSGKTDEAIDRAYKQR